MNTEKIQAFRKHLKDHRSIGIFMKSGDPAFVEAAGWAGLEFVILDCEHGPVTIERMQDNIRAAENAGVIPIIRVSELSEEAIGKALDIGAYGIEVPQITDAKSALKVIKAARFAPEGERGVCRFVRAAQYSMMPRECYFKEANQALIILQLEGTEAIQNLEEIMAVEGIDVLFIGPYDLSQSMGLTGQTTHPKVIEQMKLIVECAKAKGIIVGTFTDTTETMKMWVEAGVQYIAHSVDVGIFANACQQITEDFKNK